MKKSRNTVKFKKRKKINIGTLLFLFILVYLVASILYSRSKIQISIYEVQEQNLARELTVTGVITREERLCYVQEEGYINYYLQDGKRMKKDVAVYSIDNNRAVYDTLGYSGDPDFSEDDMMELKRRLASFGNSYSGAAFETVYALKEELTGFVNELSDQQLLAGMQDLAANTGMQGNFRFVYADQAGIISYTSDSLDGLTTDTITPATFDMESFTSNSLISSGLYAAGAPAYKIITSDEWQITCPITPDQYPTFQEKKRMKFTIEKNDFTFTAPVEFVQKASQYYVIITMTKYGPNYLKDRFLTLDIILSEENGLKIPKSSVVNKEFYLVPLECLTEGGDSNESGLTLVNYNAQTGQPEYIFHQTEIYYQDEEFAYISKNLFDSGTMIYDSSTGEIVPLARTGVLTGAYNINRGYAVFRRIEIVEEDEDYVIIRKGTSSGLSVYDHIALNAETVTEDSIIY